MVAKIKIGASLSRGFYYNENKVKDDVATCLMAENYPSDLEKMSEMQRLKVLQKTASLNPRIKANSVHISLNFSPTETLSDEKLKAIATAYMDKIGFGEQPYLVYRHNDAGHPHIHILTTRIDFSGKPINVHNIGKNMSEPARKELEKEFGLIKAEDQKKQLHQPQSAYSAKIIYGKTESKKAIASVLNNVLQQYKYASLAELNAVLKQYNVLANRGTEQSRTYKYGGLHYKILDENGRPVGVPIKASRFAQSPTLKWLQKRFEINKESKQRYKNGVKNAVDFQLLGNKKQPLQSFIKALEKEGIHVLLRKNEAGLIYGITYVDHRTQSVFNGSELGKDYSAKSILNRCHIAHEEVLKQPSIQKEQTPIEEAVHQPIKLLEELLQPEYTSQYIPYELRGKKKKRRRKN